MNFGKEDAPQRAAPYDAVQGKEYPSCKTSAHALGDGGVKRFVKPRYAVNVGAFFCREDSGHLFSLHTGGERYFAPGGDGDDHIPLKRENMVKGKESKDIIFGFEVPAHTYSLPGCEQVRVGEHDPFGFPCGS
jgi:hypothetical protein